MQERPIPRGHTEGAAETPGLLSLLLSSTLCSGHLQLQWYKGLLPQGDTVLESDSLTLKLTWVG